MDKQTEVTFISGSDKHYLLTAKSSEINQIWPSIEELVKKGILSEDYSCGQIKKMLLNKEAQLWMSVTDSKVEAILITQTLIQNGANICLLFLCSGQGMDHWLKFLEQIEAWAIEVGCDKMEIVGRRGWLKVLPEYKEKATIIEKSLWKKKILMH